MDKIKVVDENKQVSKAVESLNEEILLTLLSEANQRIAFQDGMIKSSLSHSWTLAGILGTVASSMVAILVSQLFGDKLVIPVVIMSAYGLLASSGVLAYLFLSNCLFVGWIGPGDIPADMLREDVTEEMAKLDYKDWHRFIVSSRLLSAQRDIEYNDKVQASVVKTYRIATFLTIGAIILASVILAALLLA